MIDKDYKGKIYLVQTNEHGYVTGVLEPSESVLTTLNHNTSLLFKIV